MPPGRPSLPTVSTRELLGHLAAASGDEYARRSNESPSILAFDGDGTLWSGDVSDDVFFEACRSDFLRNDAREAVVAALTSCGLPLHGTLGELGVRLHEGHLAGIVPERLLFEVMTYCYSGHREADVTAFSARVLAAKRIESRLRHSFDEVLSWARSAGHECFLVTASPAPIVVVAARYFGFDETHIVASSSATASDGRIEARLAAPIPYREGKPNELAKRARGRDLLAAFGDSPFDLDLLRAARLAVAVEPKAGLVEALRTLAHPRKLCWLPTRA
ncbi:MAG: haloacid dehalogenase-like hydrolase [Polyangiaceae bacterium]